MSSKKNLKQRKPSNQSSSGTASTSESLDSLPSLPSKKQTNSKTTKTKQQAPGMTSKLYDNVRLFAHSMFDEVPGHSVVFLRVFWGLVMAWEMYTYIMFDFSKTYHQLVHPEFLFHYYGFDWIPRFSMFTWKILIVANFCFALMFSAGLFFHFSGAAFAIIFSLLFLQDMTFYLNHFYLVVVLCIAYTFLPANKMFSLDVKLGLVKEKKTVPYWAVFLTRFIVSVVYVHAGLAKMNEDWIRGKPLVFWLPRRSARYPELSFFFDSYYVALGMSWAGMLFDTFVPFAFLKKETRPLAFICSFSFHAMNKFIFNIGIFPWVMTVVTTMFFRPDWPVAILYWLLQIDPKSLKSQPKPSKVRRTHLTTSQRFILIVAGLFCVHQTLLPLRHHIYPGQVVWNEEGHLFSWRMKLRDKAGMTKFWVRMPSKNGENTTTIVDPHELLTSRQVTKMNGRPQMILQFVNYLKGLIIDHTGHTPEIFVLSIGSVNYRPPQLMIDPTVDLAQFVPWSWVNDWILDLVPLGTTDHLYFPPDRRPSDDESKHRLYVEYGHLEIDDVMQQFEESKKRFAKQNKE